jgi:predicted nucleic acid-binding protein
MAAGDSLSSLFRLFARDKIVIPVGVLEELQRGLDVGNTYLAPVMESIQVSRIEVAPLSAEEELLTYNYPSRLGDGERQAIALAQTRKATLLSNDDHAVHYCRQKRIKFHDLADVLRLLWVRKVMSQDEVRELIGKMEQVENLVLEPDDIAEIFVMP